MYGRNPATTLRQTTETTGGILQDSHEALQGSAPDGYGRLAVEAVAVALRHLEEAQRLTDSIGEGGV